MYIWEHSIFTLYSILSMLLPLYSVLCKLYSAFKPITCSLSNRRSETRSQMAGKSRGIIAFGTLPRIRGHSIETLSPLGIDNPMYIWELHLYRWDKLRGQGEGRFSGYTGEFLSFCFYVYLGAFHLYSILYSQYAASIVLCTL
jgi:hypothetical protein